MVTEEVALEAVLGVSLLVRLVLNQMALMLWKVREALQDDRLCHPTRRNLFPVVKVKRESALIGQTLFHIRPPPVLQSPSSNLLRGLVSLPRLNCVNSTAVLSTPIPRAVTSQVCVFNFLF